MDMPAEAAAPIEKASATIRVYKADAVLFEAWCREQGVLQPIPASEDLMAGFLASEAARGVKASTISRRVAAIGYAHRLLNLPDPTRTETFRGIVRGIRGTIDEPAKPKAPVTAEVLLAILDHVPPTLTGKRDRALLVLGFSGAFRRSELVGLDVEDLVDHSDGLRVTIRRSNTDREGPDQELAIPTLQDLKPLETVTDWLAAAKITTGPIFRPVSRFGRVRGEARLTHQNVGYILKNYASQIGLDVSDFSSQSLRAGFLTEAAEQNVSKTRILSVTRHKDSRLVQSYIRRANSAKGNEGVAS